MANCTVSYRLEPGDGSVLFMCGSRCAQGVLTALNVPDERLRTDERRLKTCCATCHYCGSTFATPAAPYRCVMHPQEPCPEVQPLLTLGVAHAALELQSRTRTFLNERAWQLLEETAGGNWVLRGEVGSALELQKRLWDVRQTWAWRTN